MCIHLYIYIYIIYIYRERDRERERGRESDRERAIRLRHSVSWLPGRLALVIAAIVAWGRISHRVASHHITSWCRYTGSRIERALERGATTSASARASPGPRRRASRSRRASRGAAGPTWSWNNLMINITIMVTIGITAIINHHLRYHDYQCHHMAPQFAGPLVRSPPTLYPRRSPASR